MRKRNQDEIIGLTFNNLTVLKEVEKFTQPSGQEQRSFECLCKCGAIKRIRRSHLVSNRVKSCGCLGKKRNGQGASLLCKVWRSMKDRCDGKGSDANRRNYKDKNIRVCQDWINDFESFRIWSENNGYKKGLEIDRRDNSRGYSPDNCRWVTKLVNSNNTCTNIYVEYKGEKIALMNLIRILNLKERPEFYRYRINAGWELDKALNKPAKKTYTRIKNKT
jgi:hypothetical protein